MFLAVFSVQGNARLTDAQKQMFAENGTDVALFASLGKFGAAQLLTVKDLSTIAVQCTFDWRGGDPSSGEWVVEYSHVKKQYRFVGSSKTVTDSVKGLLLSVVGSARRGTADVVLVGNDDNDGSAGTIDLIPQMTIKRAFGIARSIGSGPVEVSCSNVRKGFLEGASLTPVRLVVPPKGSTNFQ